jgi:L-rhamnose mutarotase
MKNVVQKKILLYLTLGFLGPFSLLTSCARFLVDEKLPTHYQKKKIIPPPRLCQTLDHENKATLIHYDEDIQKWFKKAAPIFEKRSFKELVLWTLAAHMAKRPDLFTPSSTLTMALKEDHKPWQFSYAPQGLEAEILRLSLQTKSHFSSTEYFFSSRPADRLMARRIQEYWPKISGYPQLMQTYGRAQTPLLPGETLPAFSFNDFLNKRKISLKKSLKNAFSHELPFHDAPQSSLSCNFDRELYRQNVLVIDPDIPEQMSYALIRGDSMALIHVSFRPFAKPLEHSPSQENSAYFWPGRGGVRPPSLCLQKETDTLFFSYNERDSAQVLHQMLNKEALLSHQMFINHFQQAPRELILLRPPRRLYESAKAVQWSDLFAGDSSYSKELDELRSQDIPLYHVKSLGRLWLIEPGKLPENEQTRWRIHIDPREENNFCPSIEPSVPLDE